MNRWNIPDWLEREVTERDRSCVYCGVAFTGREASRVHQPSWEHITNDARIITRENIDHFYPNDALMGVDTYARF